MKSFLSVAAFLIICLDVSTISAKGRKKLGKNEDRKKMKEDIPLPTKKDHKLLDRGLDVDTHGISMGSDAEDEFVDELMVSHFERRQLNVKISHGDKKAVHQKTDFKREDFTLVKPRPYGIDTSLLGADHPIGELRSGYATNTTSCHKVRWIPLKLREDKHFFIGIDKAYTKYTEAYGIPIIGSDNVTDHGLKRACYVVTIMLASRYDIRSAFYHLYGRIALIGDGEEQTSLPEYSTWDPTYWNKRARGLGPTIAIPLTSAGDDNQRCKPGERYFDQDILVHELGHGIEQLAGHFVEPKLKSRIEKLYKKNIEQLGMWADTYAAQNPREYVAVAHQFYYDAFRGTSYQALGVRDRLSLREYDPEIAAILDDLHPCIQKNPFVHRCSWKACDLGYFKLAYGPEYTAKSECRKIKVNHNKPTPDSCAFYTCYYQGNVFQWRGSTCEVLWCDKIRTASDLAIIQGHGTYSIYRAVKMPKPDLSLELSHSVRLGCIKPFHYKTRCEPIPYSEREWYGTVDTVTKRQCKERLFCYDKETQECFKPLQDCIDESLQCPDLEYKGECERNPGYMYRHCPYSCDTCELLRTLTPGLLESMCQDKSIYCPVWAGSNQCTLNPRYMEANCAISCGQCQPKRSLVGL